MSKGRAIGSDAFKKDLIAKHREKVSQKALGYPEWAEAREVYLQNELERLRRSQKRTAADIAKNRKSAEWKVAVTSAMKQRTTVTNQWLSEPLRSGHHSEVSRLVAEWKSQNGR